MRFNVRHTVDTLARTDLEFPLGGHDFCIDTRNIDTSVQTSLVVSLDDISAVDLARSYTTVVWSLRAWETLLGPAIRSAVKTKEGVFLLQTKPWLLLGIGLHKPSAVMTVVELVGCAIVVPTLAEHEDVIAATEGIGEDFDWSEVDV